jgi:glycosyltransferase involved in cell wall biosynthesis
MRASIQEGKSFDPLTRGDTARPLRVLLIGDFPADFTRPRGGVETVVNNVAHGLVAAGIEVTVVRFGAEGVPGPAPSAFEVIDVPRRRPGSIGNWLVSPFDIQKIVERVRPDVVHLQGIPELYRGTSPPPVLTVHGIPYRDAVYGKGLARRFLQPLVIRATFSSALRRCRHVIAISSYVGEELASKKWLQLHQIPNPVEDAFFEVERRPVPGRVLYVGVLSARKNIIGLIDSAAIARESIPGLRLRFAGPWLGDTEAATRTAIDRTGMHDAVEFLGPLSRLQVLEELTTCACLGLASFQETAPMAIAEAMAAGVPVVSSSAGGVDSMVEQGVTGRVSPIGDNHAFAENLVAILGDEARAATMGIAARAAAENHYRLARVIEKTIDVYRAALCDRAS